MTPTNKYGVVSKETAKELKNAGFNIKTAFHYNSKGRLCEMVESGETLYLGSDKWGISYFNGDAYTPAPNFEDILGILPKSIQYDGCTFRPHFDYVGREIGYYDSFEDCHLFVDNDIDKFVSCSYKNGIAEAAAKILLLLIKYNLITDERIEIGLINKATFDYLTEKRKIYGNIAVLKDGAAFICHGENFEDLQVSIAGFGDTIIEAIDNYIEKLV